MPTGCPDLFEIASASEVVLACGGGGVGKTSVAAAAGLQIALERAGKVLVLTVDPAKRLATALGLDSLGNALKRVPDDAFIQAGLDKPKGELWVAMLDMKQSWDDLVSRHAPDKDTRDKILSNPLYESITSRFIQSHDYIAVERLYEEYTSHKFDLIVVDTPPSRNAMDFLDAPKRMADFLSSRLLKWLIMPYRSKLISMASRPFYQIADKILGSQFLVDISEFFVAFQSMYDGFKKRAVEVEVLLKGQGTSFIIVTTLEEVPSREAETFVEELGKRKMNLRGIVLNKVLPEYFMDVDTLKLANKIASDPVGIASKLSLSGAGGAGGKDDMDESLYSTTLYEIAGSFLDFHQASYNEQIQRAKFEDGGYSTIVLPRLDDDISDLGGLAALTGYIPNETAV